MSRVVVIGATGHNGQADVGGQPFAEMCDLTVAGTTVKSHICGVPQGR
jgi:hypothetical protein